MKYSQLITLVNKIISQYSIRLTLRQIYYRLVTDYALPNKRASYNQLSSQLVTARENGEVDEDRIEDRTRSFLGGDSGWDNPEQFIKAVKRYFMNYWDNYDRKIWADQDEFVIVWVEKDALSRVLSSVADRWKVITAPSKGYASFTYVKAALEKMPEDKDITILHFSDHDPSGLDMTRDLEERVNRYARQAGFHNRIIVERRALTIDQVKQYNLVPNPTKMSDTRTSDYATQYGEECWELDAIEPNELQRLVEEAILEHLDQEQWDKSLARVEEEKAELKEKFAKWKEKLDELDEEEKGED
jgi:hypothetical protein